MPSVQAGVISHPFGSGAHPPFGGERHDTFSAHPAFAGISVFRWDISIRESTIVGLVGAGGIGVQFESSLARLAWSEITFRNGYRQKSVAASFSAWPSHSMAWDILRAPGRSGSLLKTDTRADL